ncbi:MAG TPA: DUF481 domain-containing protein [Blastocatellia bacterium]|nr:DUF481 domain-containing protein [Blastocatellia bacterium]
MVSAFFKTLVLGLALMTGGGCCRVAAQEPAATPATPPSPPSPVEAEKKAEAAKKAALGNWWERNASTYDPIPTRWLFHVEGTLSYQQLSGNSSGKVLNGNSRLIVRKEKLSTYLTYKHQLQDVRYGGGTGVVDLEKRNLVGILRYDLNRRVYLAGGAVKTRDDSFNIADRQIYYGGVGTIYSPKPAHLVGLLGAFGHHKSIYELDGLRLKQTGLAPYLEISWVWTVTERMSINAFADYLQYQERSTLDQGSGQGRSSDCSLSLNVQLTKHLALSFGNNFRYEDNQIVRLTSARKIDNAALIGVKFSY